MAQSIILAAGATRAMSTDVTVLAAAHVYVGIYAAAGTSLDPTVKATVWLDTPATDAVQTRLDAAQPFVKLIGPGVWRIERLEGAACGVWLDT